MAHLKLTVRNLYGYPCDLSFSDQDSFRNHHNSPHKIPLHSTSIDTKVETNVDANSDEIGSSSPTKNRKKRKKMDMEMENSNENTENSKSMKSKSKPNEKNDSVLQPSNKFNLSKYKDYIHCCKCFSTFYTLTNLINHFDKCNIQRDESGNFKDFKQQNSHNLSHQVNTTKTTTTEDEEENQLLNDDFVNEVILSPFTHDNNNDDDDNDEEEKKITKSADYSTSENLNVNSSPQNVEDQNEDFCDIEIKSEPESEFESEPESIKSECEMEEEKGEKKNSKGQSQQRQKQKPKERKERLPFKCPVESCSSLSFPYTALFLRHKRQVHNYKETKTSCVLCSTCGKSVASQFDLLCHMNEHTGYKPYKCNFESCGASFTIRAKYLNHLYVTHKTKKDMFKCPDKTGCDKAFTNTTELRKHLQSCHAGSIFYKCTKCDEGFLTAEDRWNHHLRVHGEYKFKCEVENCGKLFKSIASLKKHGLTHQSEQPFECDFPGCGAKLKEKNALQRHNKVIHQNQQQCLCSQCGKTCRDINGYRRHLLVHTQEKSFICQYCGRGFSLRDSLKTHTLIHLGEKQRKCQFCDKTFRRGTALKRHEQTHTKINPYKCAFCDAVFPDNRPLKKHVAAAHADEEFDLNIPSTYQREKPSSSRNPIPIPETVEEP